MKVHSYVMIVAVLGSFLLFFTFCTTPVPFPDEKVVDASQTDHMVDDNLFEKDATSEELLSLREKLAESLPPEQSLERENKTPSPEIILKERKSIDVPSKCPPSVSLCPTHPTQALFDLRIPPIKNWRFRGITPIATDGESLFFGVKIMRASTSGLTSTRLYAITSKGRLLWSKLFKFVFPYPVITVNKNIVIAGNGADIRSGRKVSNIYLVNRKTADAFWNTTIHGELLGRPSTSADTLYIADKNLYAIELASGKIKWKVSLDDGTTSRFPFRREFSPVVGKENIYISSNTGSILAFDKSGKKKWSVPIPTNVPRRRFHQMTAIGKDGNLYIASRYVLFSISPNGKILWKYYKQHPISSLDEFTIDKKGNLYISQSSNQKLTLLALSSGGIVRQKLSFAENSIIGPPPSIHKNGLVYLGTCGLLTCLRLVGFDGKRKKVYYGYGRNMYPAYNQITSSGHYLLWVTDLTYKDGIRFVLISVNLGISKLTGLWPAFYKNSRLSSSAE